MQTRLTLNRASTNYMVDLVQNNGLGKNEILKLMDQADTSLKQAEEYWSAFKKLPRLTEQNKSIESELKIMYKNYHDALADLIKFMREDNFQAYLAQPTQLNQDNFEKIYVGYVSHNDHIYDSMLENTIIAYGQAIWILVVVLSLGLFVMVCVWKGVRVLLITPLSHIITSIRYIGDGDLQREIDVEGSNEMGELAENLRYMQSELARMVTEVRNAADAIYSGASEISLGNNDLSCRTEQQAASLEETAASMEELTATVKQNTDNAHQASGLSVKASDTAEKGREMVNDVVRTMRDISDSSQEIADITGV